MSSREQHYAKVREALTDALRKIETDDDDDDDQSNVMMIPTPFVEFPRQISRADVPGSTNRASDWRRSRRSRK